VPNNLKILVIRLSSIGDIILITPVIRCLKSQLNAEIDFLTKSQYKDLLASNENIDRIFSFDQKNKETIETLRSNNYHLVIDLQNNFRSFKIRFFLGIKSYVFSKENFKRHLLIYFGVNLLNNHIVDRYFKTVKKLNIFNDNKGIDYRLINPLKIDFDTDQDYIAWCVGGAHNKKQLSATQIYNVISRIDIPVVLLGADKDQQISSEVIKKSANNVYDFCGKTSIDDSAHLMKLSKLVLTNDTGMMHIACAFNVPIISFWGCTKPSLGFSPYMANDTSVKIITGVSKRPCSKHGKYCRIHANGCVKEISAERIYDAVISLLK